MSNLYDCYDHEYESKWIQCPCCVKDRLKTIPEKVEEDEVQE